MRAALHASALAQLATRALLAEAELTPKPGLVDRRGAGAHRDLSLPLMRLSAYTLTPFFAEMARTAHGRMPDPRLRKELASVGLRAEWAMLTATGGRNTHKGAIWTVGLLVAGAAMCQDHRPAAQSIAILAGETARQPDPFAVCERSHGRLAGRKYGVGGARDEASQSFPHVIGHGLPLLRQSRKTGAERIARLNALLAIMSSLDDTCLLHRAGRGGLDTARAGARDVLASGGAGTHSGSARLKDLDAELLRRDASPGGSADLLAAALLLHAIETDNGKL